MRYPNVTREADTAPADPKIGAFFDVDRTLLAGFSASAFLRRQVVEGGISLGELARGITAAVQFGRGQTSFPTFVRDLSTGWRGRSKADLRAFGERVFRTSLAGAIYPEARALVEAHRARGHTVAIVSSATRFQTEPLAGELGIPHVLCTELQFRKGRFTGEIEPPACFGPGKALAAQQLAELHDLDLSQSFFYTDSCDDLPLLEIVGHPRPLNPESRLEELARERGWPVQHFESRGPPGLETVARTGLAVASLLPSIAAGIPVALLNQRLREAVNLSMGAWGDFGTALAGIELLVEGEENLWARRPAVFIFNHQSALDTLLVAKLVRRDVVGIAKKELRDHPLLGPVFALAGTVFIDRTDRSKAIQALEPAVEALRKGLSIAIAPEGTRSPGPRPGPFKKGAFHLALAARVPVVPIVLRNAHDLMPKHAWFIRPGTVEVRVHPPIATDTWRAKQLAAHIAEIEALYRATLEG